MNIEEAELKKEIPKAKENQYTKSANCPRGQEPKQKTVKEMGFSNKQVSQFQRLADNKEDEY